ncbi:MAG TPA: cyclic nucleotide-binding domain-containing protein [Candidatus Dormibacteraeota bacterium]|nr:cyclic nucleotide-binding domain-containing protein [Candidatus Dormibacteraeota bacterium]
MATLRDDVVPILERTMLFQGYSRPEIAALAAEFDEQTYLAGRNVLAEGRRGVDFFVIIDGEAVVHSDDQEVARLRPGDFFGEIAALDGGPRTASVKTVGQVRCLSLANGSFRPFLERNPRFAINVLNAVVRRLRTVVTSAPGQP